MRLLAAALAATTPALALAADGLDTGDTAFVLLSAGLVLLMTPGLAFFYGGLVRAKNVVHTMNMSLVCMAFVGVLWALFGYSLAFSPGGGLDRFIGGFAWAGLVGVGARPEPSLAATIPHGAFMLFQAMFAIITPALISGAIVERVRLKAFILFTAPLEPGRLRAGGPLGLGAGRLAARPRGPRLRRRHGGAHQRGGRGGGRARRCSASGAASRPRR